MPNMIFFFFAFSKYIDYLVKYILTIDTKHKIPPNNSAAYKAKQSFLGILEIIGGGDKFRQNSLWAS